MVQSNFESKVRIQEIIDNQIPEFILEENPKFSEFLKQYYISQEYQGASVDIVENLVEYLKLDMQWDLCVENVRSRHKSGNS